ncbi:hypothetical protein CRD60_04605 [Bifidobacterium aemilianum]|uniref:Integral membrane protein n=1 Tax=Bifidobacterium aemilianum TaxID=2493120 RepID=A0A366K7Z2_9BIFI|nr:SCO6880 family protein [Bifidobacterium aemilianum]RBP97870.1 hypothetical protein CRD60_04605 [Bifidobacterium aemilianum]
MASSTTYGDWMRRIPGGIKNIGKPLTFAGFAVLVAALVLSMVNVLAAGGVLVLGIGTITILSVRDREHRNVVDRKIEQLAYRTSMRKGRNLYRSGMLAPIDGGMAALPGILSRIGLVEALDGFGRPFCLLHHAHSGEYSLPLTCHPQGAALVDDDVEDSYVASWAAFLDFLSTEVGVRQLSVTVDTSPDSGIRFRKTLARNVVADAPELAAKAMAQVMGLYSTGGARSEATLTLTFCFKDVRGRFLEPEEAARRIGQMIPDIEEHVADAGGGSPTMLGLDQMARMVRICFDPAAQDKFEDMDEQHPTFWEDAGPMAHEAMWDWYRHDSGVSRSWEMCDPPRSSVTADTISRLLKPLEDCDRKRVTLQFRLASPERTAFMAEQNRQLATSQVSQEKRATVKSMTQIAKANRQAQEAEQGAMIVFFGLVVTVTVMAGEGEQDRLEMASRAVESAAGSAKDDLRICYGAQDTAFAASLPLGLTLASYAPPGLLGHLR